MFGDGKCFPIFSISMVMKCDFDNVPGNSDAEKNVSLEDFDFLIVNYSFFFYNIFHVRI